MLGRGIVTVNVNDLTDVKASECTHYAHMHLMVEASLSLRIHYFIPDNFHPFFCIYSKIGGIYAWYLTLSHLEGQINA